MENMESPGDTVDGRNPANQLRGSLSHYIYRVLYMLCGAVDFFHQECGSINGILEDRENTHVFFYITLIVFFFFCRGGGTG